MSNDHPVELLPLIAGGEVPEPSVRDHVATCSRCTEAVAASSSLDLGYVWAGITSELDAPAPSMLERVFEALGLESSLARFGAATPSLRLAWIAGMAAVAGVCLALSFFPNQSQISPLLIAAPLIGAAAVSFAYGPHADPAYEVTAPTPISTLACLIVRIAAVLAADAIIVGIGVAIASIARPSGEIAHHAFSWLLPMLAVSLLAAIVAGRTKPVIGAAVGMGSWTVFVLVVRGAAVQPGMRIWGATSQIGYAVVVAVAAILLYHWSARGAMPIPMSAWEE